MEFLEKDYLVAFSTVPGIGPARLRLLINYFGSAGKAWTAKNEQLSEVGLPKDVLQILFEQRAKLNVKAYIQNVLSRGIKIVTIFDEDYPERLKNIPNPPNVLYLKTSLTVQEFKSLMAQRVVAVVGTRKMTAYGKEVTQMLTRDLCASGFTIVSGMALGVDGIAHGTTLNCGGKTVAVLGAGVEVVYPSQHRDLYNSILEKGGIIVSEVAPEKFVARGVFPARNRIISGLAQAVLVTEGAIDSGSLITARAALEQGREVFAVPGPINSFLNEGTNYLLKNGAKLVSSVGDILEELHCEIKDKGNGTKDRKREIKGETQEEQKIIDLLFNEALDFDELVRRTGIPAGRLGSISTLMEVRGVLRKDGLNFSLV